MLEQLARHGVLGALQLKVGRPVCEPLGLCRAVLLDTPLPSQIWGSATGTVTDVSANTAFSSMYQLCTFHQLISLSFLGFRTSKHGGHPCEYPWGLIMVWGVLRVAELQGLPVGLVWPGV